MASVALLGRTSISKFEAEQEFDLLFDEYFKEDVFTAQALCKTTGGGIRSDGGSPAVESDEVYKVPGEQAEPQQVYQQTIAEVARELRILGDQYADALERANNSLTPLFLQVPELKYDTFKNAFESIQPHDRNAVNFVFMMCVSKQVVSHVGHLAGKAKNYFRRYIGDIYIEPIAEAGGVREYVRQ